MSSEEVKSESQPIMECTNGYSALPGFVDVQVISNDNARTLLTEELVISVPVCKLEQLDWYQRIFIDELLSA